LFCNVDFSSADNLGFDGSRDNLDDTRLTKDLMMRRLCDILLELFEIDREFRHDSYGGRRVEDKERFVLPFIAANGIHIDRPDKLIRIETLSRIIHFHRLFVLNRGPVVDTTGKTQSPMSNPTTHTHGVTFTELNSMHGAELNRFWERNLSAFCPNTA
jgi:hypothetical protein